MPGLAYLLLG
ncbi:hypothetical protein YPPY64_2000, partial [Yersinia pestis PY-64]